MEQLTMERLKRRTDFRAISEAGVRAPAKAFVLQALQRQEADQESGPVRVGFTVSRQVGNAVERNRVRRRLREMVRLKANMAGDKTAFTPGYDYVLIGRRTALTCPFGDMTKELDGALRRVATGAAAKPPLNRAGPVKGRDKGTDVRAARGKGRHGQPKTATAKPAKEH
jgi:ribonuclease P protein component